MLDESATGEVRGATAKESERDDSAFRGRAPELSPIAQGSASVASRKAAKVGSLRPGFSLARTQLERVERESGTMVEMSAETIFLLPP